MRRGASGLVVLGGVVLLAAGCGLMQRQPRGAPAGGGHAAAGGAGGEPGVAATAAAEPPRDPHAPPEMAPLSGEAAHPALAGLLREARSLSSMELEQYALLYGYDLSGTTGGRATVLDLHLFGVERAMTAILPPVLEHCRAPEAARMARRGGRVTDPGSLLEANQLLADVRQRALEESDGAPGSTYDREQWGDCVTAATDGVRGMMDRLKHRAATQQLGSGVDALAPWVTILERGERMGIGGAKIAEVLSDQVGHARELVRSGRVPPATRRMRSKPPHPALVMYLDVLNTDVHDLAELLAVNISDTRRGRNVDVAVFAVDVAVRELAPRLVTFCGAGLQAQAVADLPTIRDARTLEIAAERLAIMTHHDQPEQQRRCVDFGVSGAREAIGNASDAFRFERGDYNLEPEYVRGAFTPWARELRRLREHRLTGTFVEESRTMLERAARHLSRQRRR